jgi:TetR/AcrR family tetracycline transcriptional repressor
MGARKQVTRDQVVAEARGLLQEQGPETFSLRLLAQRLGIAAPSLLWHVGSREQLLVSVVDDYLRELTVPERTSAADAEAWLRDVAHATRAHLLAEPNLVPVIRDLCFLAPAIVDIESSIAEALVDLGLKSADLVSAHFAFLGYVLGSTFIYAGREAAAGRHLGALEEAMDRKQAQAEADHPRVVEALRGYAATDDDGEALFAESLNALLAAWSHPTNAVPRQ